MWKLKDSHFLLQEIFPTQRSNLGFLNCRRILYCLSHPELLLYFICKFKVGNVTYKYFPCSVVLSFLSLNKVFHRANVFHSCWSPSYLFFFLLWPCFGIIQRRQWHPTPVFLPGESQGRRSLVGCRLWGRRVGRDWSNLAAAVGIIRYFLLGNNDSFSQWPSMIVQTLVFNFPSSNEMETTRHFWIVVLEKTPEGGDQTSQT